MLPFLFLLDWQIGHTQIQPVLLKISQLYQAAATFPSSSPLRYLPHNVSMAEAASKSPICQILTRLRPGFPLQIPSCRLPIVNSMDFQALYNFSFLIPFHISSPLPASEFGKSSCKVPP